jgi:hypothetical protein
MFYEDDHFHPNNLDDEMEGNEVGSYMYPGQAVDRHLYEPSEHSGNTLETYRKNQRKNMGEYKMIDKGFRKITILSKGKPVEVEYYQTLSTPGIMIRDAITGARYKEYRVGSKEEDLFFKVRLAIGKSDIDSMLLFYDSPEVYEGHMRTIVSPQRKETWRNRHAIANKLNEEKQARRPGFVAIR